MKMRGKERKVERRKYVRLEPKEPIPVQFKIVSRDEHLKELGMERAAVHNVSGGGMCLKLPHLGKDVLDELLQGRMKLLLQIGIPTVSHPISALAKIVWVEGRGKGYSAGVSFVEIDEADRDKIMDYVIDNL